MKTQTQHRRAVFARFEAMAEVYPRLHPLDRLDLERWDREVVDGCTIGTSDWPGWDRYLGSVTVPPPPKRKPTRPKAEIPPRIRWAVWERDDFTCQHCGARRYLSVDHIIPESKGGTLTLDNLQTLCRSCNSRKGTRT